MREINRAEKGKGNKTEERYTPREIERAEKESKIQIKTYIARD